MRSYANPYFHQDSPDIQIKLPPLLDSNIWPVFGHVQLERVPAAANVDKELETQVFRKGALSGRKLRAAVLKRIRIQAAE